jgi:hypothetical protein
MGVHRGASEPSPSRIAVSPRYSPHPHITPWTPHRLFIHSVLRTGAISEIRLLHLPVSPRISFHAYTLPVDAFDTHLRTRTTTANRIIEREHQGSLGSQHVACSSSDLPRTPQPDGEQHTCATTGNTCLSHHDGTSSGTARSVREQRLVSQHNAQRHQTRPMQSWPMSRAIQMRSATFIGISSI